MYKYIQFKLIFLLQGFLDENDSEPVLFGDYEFVSSDNNLQYFPVKVSYILNI